jgi:hypothetical protein
MDFQNEMFSEFFMDFQNEIFSEFVYEVFDEKCMQ